MDGLTVYHCRAAQPEGRAWARVIVPFSWQTRSPGYAERGRAQLPKAPERCSFISLY